MAQKVRNPNIESQNAPAQFGRLSTFDEIEVGPEYTRVWTITPDTIDLYMLMHDEYHEWYAIDSPFGGRVAPPNASWNIVRAMLPYNVRGLFAGAEYELFDVLRPDVPYLWKGKVSDKYIRRDRERIVYDGICVHPDGHEVLRTKRLHALHYVPIGQRSEKPSEAPVKQSVKDVQEEEPNYSPPEFIPRDPGAWNRDTVEVPVSHIHYGHVDTPLGTELLPVSKQYTWRKVRDASEMSYGNLYGWPDWARAYNIHTNAEAAAAYGLPEPNVGSPDQVAMLSNMMLAFAGPGWLVGGRFSLRWIRPMALTDFVTAKGRLVGKQIENENVRLECEVWVENQRGEKTVVGKASGVIPR